MKGKITLLVGGAVGYVLGTRDGRERYEQIKSQAQSLWNNPKVQEKATAAQDFAKEKAPEVKDKVTGAVKDKTGQSDSDTPGTTTTSTTTTGTTTGTTGTSPTTGTTGTGYPTTATTGLN